MTPRQIDIADMQCWLLRMAERKWGISSAQVAELFQSNGVFDYISDLYGILHVSSYDSALSDVENLLRSKGALPC